MADCCEHDTEPQISIKITIFLLFLVYKSMTRSCNANIQMLHIQDQCLLCPTFNASEINSKRLQESKIRHILT